MVIVLVMSSISVSSATTSTPSEADLTTEFSANVTRANNYPYPSSTSSLYVSSSSWATVASSTSGFNCNVVVSGLVIGNYCMDVHILNRNGNIVWSEENAFNTIGGNGGSRTFWCGNDI